ncbi:MAG: hypothetical protein R2874_12340 [Desulfobacterales bacterium]
MQYRNRRIIENRLSGTKRPWGFKRYQNRDGPALVEQGVRSGGVIQYLFWPQEIGCSGCFAKRFYEIKGELAELRGFKRTTDALHYTAADCFIFHYEDWFDDSESQKMALLKYTGLDRFFTGSLKDLVVLLNRKLNQVGISLACRMNMYKIIQRIEEACRGADFDRARHGMVKECRKAMHNFKGWYLVAHKHIAQIRNRRHVCWGGMIRLKSCRNR